MLSSFFYRKSARSWMLMSPAANKAEKSGNRSLSSRFLRMMMLFMESCSLLACKPTAKHDNFSFHETLILKCLMGTTNILSCIFPHVKNFFAYFGHFLIVL